MIMAWDTYGAPSEPTKKRILFVLRDFVVAAKVRADLGQANLTTIAPGLGCFEKDFDIIIVCYEITLASEQRWFHEKVVPLLSPNGVIYWPT